MYLSPVFAGHTIKAPIFFAKKVCKVGQVMVRYPTPQSIRGEEWSRVRVGSRVHNNYLTDESDIQQDPVRRLLLSLFLLPKSGLTSYQTPPTMTTTTPPLMISLHLSPVS